MRGGPLNIGWEPGSKIRTDLVIFGVEARSFFHEDPDGLAKNVMQGRRGSPDFFLFFGKLHFYPATTTYTRVTCGWSVYKRFYGKGGGGEDR